MNVQEWIASGQPYSAGVLLYQALGGRTNLKRFVQQMGQSHVHPQIRKELKTRLSKLAPKSKKKITTIELTETPGKTDPAPIVITAPRAPAPEETEPAQIKHLRAKARSHLKRRDDAFSRMKAATNDLDRYKYAEELITVWEPAIDEIYDLIRRWEDTGEMPSAGREHEIKIKVIDAFKKRDSLKSNLRGKRKLLTKSTDTEDIKTIQTKIDALQRELDDINEYLE